MALSRRALRLIASNDLFTPKRREPGYGTEAVRITTAGIGAIPEDLPPAFYISRRVRAAYFEQASRSRHVTVAETP